MSHPDESDVSLLFFFFFQAVGFFVTETVLFLLLPDLEARWTLRTEAPPCCAHQTEHRVGHPHSGHMEFSEQSMGQLPSYGKSLRCEFKPRLLRPGWSQASQFSLK